MPLFNEYTKTEQLYAAKFARICNDALGRAVLSDRITKIRIQKEAVAYIFSEDDGPDSFEQLCDIIGVNVGYVRRKIREGVAERSRSRQILRVVK